MPCGSSENVLPLRPTVDSGARHPVLQVGGSPLWQEEIGHFLHLLSAWSTVNMDGTGEGESGNVRNLKWRNSVQRKFGTNPQMPLQNVGQNPRLWHKKKHRP